MMPRCHLPLPRSLGFGQGSIYEGTACERHAGAGGVIHLLSTIAQAVGLDESLPYEHAFPIKAALAGN